MKTPIYTGIFQSDLEAAGYRISGLPTPAVDSEAATKKYVDDNAGGGGSTPNTVTSTDIGLVGDGVTDNTAIFQAWLNTVDSNTTLIVEDGVYIFSGPLQDTSDASPRNSQILLPLPNHYFTLTIKGRQAIPSWCDHVVPVPRPPLPPGARFKSTLATGGGTQPSFIGGYGVVADQNPIHLCIENMIFQTVANPLISCLDFETVTWVDFTGDVAIWAGENLDNPSIIEPTHSDSYGLIMPRTNIGVLHTVGNIHVYGFYTGVRFGEIAHVKNMGFYACKNGIEFPAAFHVNLIERILFYHCQNGINVVRGSDLTVPAIAPFTIVQLDIEHENPAGPWYTTVYDINDASNYAVGDIAWWVVKGGVGVDTTFTVNGGTGINYRRVGSDTHAGPVYIGTDARLTAISGGVKLECRNTGTGTWVEATRYTNP